MSEPSEIGSVVFFEHVNLRVPDHRAATLYFVEGLGLTRDPHRMVGVRNMWVNVGLQQFHLPIGEPSTLPGEVGVVVPDLAAVERQLEAVGRELSGSRFTVERFSGGLRTTTPWGHRLRVHQHTPQWGRLPQALPYVEFEVAPGSAAGIGAFYRDVLDCTVEERPLEGHPAVHVTVGPRQTFRFRECPGGGPVTSENHVAIYVTHYRRIYAELQKREAVMEGDDGEQFRFDRIPDLATGALLFRFEHEVRSLSHPDYRRPLVNRVPLPYRVD